MAVQANNIIYLIVTEGCVACEIQVKLLMKSVLFNNNAIIDKHKKLRIHIVDNNSIPEFIQKSDSVEINDFPITVFTKNKEIVSCLYTTETFNNLNAIIDCIYK